MVSSHTEESRPAMTKTQTTPVGAALVAIDIAKLRNDVLIEVPDARRRRRLTVTNCRAEHDRLVAELQALARPITVGLEPTGHYHRPLAWRLLQAGFDVRLISSVALARTREALHNSWDKNDPKDAQVILHMLRIGATQPYHDPLACGINDIQEMSMTHEVISKAKTEVLHRIQTHYLPLYFPEVDRFRSNTRSDWFFALLERFPVPASITALSKEAFIAAAWDVAGRKVAKARLLGDIYETARTSIALPITPDTPAIAMFRLVIAEARHLIRQRDAIERLAGELLGEHADFRRLQQVPGIGPIIRQRENSFRAKFERYVAKDRHDADLRRKAFTAITAKMARVVHAVIKSGADYRPFVEGPVPGGRTPLCWSREGAQATL